MNTIYNKILALLVFSFLLMPLIEGLRSQTPGGSNLTIEVWLAADNITGLSNGASVDNWPSVVTGGRNYTKSTLNSNATYNTTPIYKSSGDGLFNYQPALKFNGINKLINNTNIFSATSKAYYVFYVSRVDNNGSNAVFEFSANGSGTGTRNNNLGWYLGNPYFALGGAVTSNNYGRSHQGNGKQYGINSAIITNSGPDYPGSFMNGIPNDKGFIARAMSSSSATASVIGNSNSRNSGLPFTGDLQELIILSGPLGSFIADDDLNRIHSYLAIKYGITLEKGNYYRSDSEVIWNRAANAEYSDAIFGIGRDDDAGLYQKQAASTDVPVIAVSLGDFKTLNKDNSANIDSDGVFLMFGSKNRATANTSYIYPAGTLFDGGFTISSSLESRTSYTLKAQLKDKASFVVNMKIVDKYLSSKAKYLLVSQDPDFTPINTRVYTFDNDYIAHNVQINHGDYITVTTEKSEARPGAVVGNYEVWLSADKVNGPGQPLPAHGTSIDKWTSVHSGGRDYEKSTQGSAANNNIVPTFKSSGDLFNYQPALNFSTSQAKLINANQLDPTKAYHIFYVSKVTNTSAANVILSLNTGTNTTSSNNNIGWYEGLPYFSFSSTTSGNRRPHQGNGKLYGINSAIIPNGNIPRSYLNGVINTTNFATGTFSSTSNNFSIIGNSTMNSALPFYGDLQELIVVSDTRGAYMDDFDLNRINSYLAVKYAITLEDMNYIGSDGEIIWDSKNSDADYSSTSIFGIGRDDESGLYQKQAVSTEYPLLAISLGNFEILNSENTSTIDSDRAYLMLGSRGKVGTSGYHYDYPAGTLYANGLTSPVDVNIRNAYVLKARLTNKSQFNVNFKLIEQKLIDEASFMIVSSNPIFPPDETRIYTIGSNNIVSNVEINDNDYISFAFKEAGTIVGPGGIYKDLRLWLNAGVASSIDVDGSGNVTRWQDVSGVSNTVYRYMNLTTANQAPGYEDCHEMMNFHPSVNFRKVGEYLSTENAPMSIQQPKEFTLAFGIYNDFIKSSRSYFIGFGDKTPGGGISRRPAIGMYTTASTPVRGRYYEYSGAGSVQGGKELFLPGATSINLTEVNANASNRYVRFESDGDYELITGSTVNGLGTNLNMNGNGLIGAGSEASYQLVGVMGEALAFERILEDEEKNRLYAYLGIKYAATLDFDKLSDLLNFDYQLSGGRSVWNGNAAPNMNFHNNVAGLVRDDAADLFNNKARSTNVNSCITMMVKGHAECGQGSVSGLPNDQSGLFWGNDGGETNVTYAYEECFEFTERTSRIWLVQKSNWDEAPVTIKVGLGLPDISGFINASTTAYLLIADSPEDFENKTWRLTIPGTYKDGEHHFDYTFNQEHTYFALAFNKSNTYCETCSFKGEDTYSFTRATLGASRLRLSGSTYTHQLNNIYTENGNLKMDIKFERGSGLNSMTIRPRTGGVTRLEASGAANALSRITYTLDEPADVSFAIGDIDRNEIVEVYGYCEGDKVLPSYVYKESLAGLSAANQRRGHTFTIQSTSKAYGNGMSCPNSGRNMARGKMHVEFGFPVEEIVIEYTSGRSGARYFDLYPMKFSCPQPPPQPNEAGYGMQKRGPLEAHICEIVDYSFIMLNANANCDMSRVCLTDTLPEGMYWVPNSLVIDESILDTTIMAQGKPSVTMDDRILRIDSVILKGDGNITIVRASAAFRDNATINTTYYNQSQINYIRKDNGQPEALRSTDIYYTGGGDERTPTYVLNEVRDFFAITSSMTVAPSACFRENNEIEVTVEVTNPNNKELNDMVFEMGYSENFHFIDLLGSSFRVNGVVPSGLTMYIEKDEDGEDMPGFAIVEGFKLAANGVTTISYKVKAPIKTDLEVDIDPVTSEITYYYPLDLDYDLFTEEEAGLCVQNAFLDAGGFYELPYCSGKTHIVTNKHVTTRIKR